MTILLHKYFMKKFIRYAVAIAILLLLFSCKSGKNTTKVLERQDLFSLNYGNFEDELNLSKMDQGTYSVVNVCLNNGIFYISSASGQKVLKTSSYGDLLSLYYNPATNPRPSFYKKIQDGQNPETGENMPGTRTIIEYPFRNCTFLQVNELENLYVVDTVPNDRIQFDSEENIALSNVILQFDEKGKFVDYIGQEGLGGTPFPNIVSLSTNADNDIIAVCKTLMATKVFWFNREGLLLSRIDLNNSALPFPYEKDKNFFMNIDAVFPSYQEPALFLKIDYYVEDFDDITGASTGVNYDKSSIYKITLSEGAFEHVADVAPFEDISDDETGSVKKVYMLMNVCRDDWAFLMSQTDTAYSILLLNMKTGETKKINLGLENMSLLYSTFSVTKDCMLAGLFADEDKITISVWHIENFIN